MIIFIEHGRLGNQLFQYAALRSFAPDERLILIGFDDLQAVFDNPNATILLSSRSLLFRFLKLLRLREGLNTWLPRLRIVTTLHEEKTDSGVEIRIRPGLFSFLKYAVTGFFQSETSFDSSVVSELRFRQELQSKAAKTMQKIRKQHSHVFFVHVRRGDYLSWPSRPAPAVLPATWYRECIDTLVGNDGSKSAFVFCTDDSFYVNDVFGNDEKSFFISNGTAAEDFVLMSSCDGGVLSASSFAWWAGYFVNRKTGAARLLVPEFWAGHRNGEIYPPAIIAKHFVTVPVMRQDSILRSLSDAQ